METGRDKVLLYLHVPKTGGTTIGVDILYPQYANPAYYCDESGLLHAGVYYFPGSGFFKPKDLRLPKESLAPLRHPDLRVVTGHFWFGIHEHVPKPSTYATILRHPVDRLISLYKHVTKRPVEDRHSLEQFLAHPRWREVDNDQLRRLSGIEPPLGECTHDMHAVAKRNIDECFAVVGTLERFDTSLVAMKRALGWARVPGYYPQNNSGVPSSHRMPEDVKARLEQWCSLEMALWEEANAKLDRLVHEPGFAADAAKLEESKRTFLDRDRADTPLGRSCDPR